MAEKRNGFKYVQSFEQDEPIVSMVEHLGKLYIATSKRIFVHEDGKIKQLELVIKE